MLRLATALASILALVIAPEMGAQATELAVASNFEISDSTSHAGPSLIDSDAARTARAQLGTPPRSAVAALTRLPRHRFVLVGAAAGGAAGLAWVLSRSSMEGLSGLALPFGLFIGASGARSRGARSVSP